MGAQWGPTRTDGKQLFINVAAKSIYELHLRINAPAEVSDEVTFGHVKSVRAESTKCLLVQSWKRVQRCTVQERNQIHP